MKTGIFGGTFNPIHFGHLRAALEAAEAAQLDRVVFVPSFIPPHKVLDYDVPGGKRLEMVRLATRNNDLFCVSEFEVKDQKISYSTHTIDFIAEKFDATPYFILGQDAFNDLSTWYDLDGVLAKTNFIVMSRPGSLRPSIDRILGEKASIFTKNATGYTSSAGTEIIFTPVTMLDISSSLIRSCVKSGRSIKYLVPAGVEEYILRERMYS